MSFAVAASVVDLVGNTPLVRLATLSAATGVDIYGKCEFMNPGGSVKDRAVVAMLRDANLAEGSTVVEGTAGNTGAALCFFGAALKLKVLLTVPDKVSTRLF